MNRLAGIYYMGEITVQRDVLAVKWATIAKSMGNKMAIENYDGMLKNIDPTQVKYGQEMAKDWITLRSILLKGPR